MWVYLSEKPVFTDFTDESALVWYEAGIPYATYVPEARRSLEYTYFPSKVSSWQHPLLLNYLLLSCGRLSRRGWFG